MAKIPTALRSLVTERAKGRCEYCLCPAALSPDSFPIDHIIPVSLDGKTELQNLAYSCGGCNGHKHKRINAIDPLTNQFTPLFHPRQDEWGEHFQWSEDGLYILGISTIGRATESLLQLNRASNLNLRRLLKSVGLHPPQN
ncbi:MAG: HNH endonuclease [Saprospiraceae bacterium]|jgi:hypothetical protein|nr:HNH endonuclease [Lewinellaceae bacterium]MBP6810141.1 HNH endonuclease [Saprospiraceae bacterium]